AGGGAGRRSGRCRRWTASRDRPRRRDPRSRRWRRVGDARERERQRQRGHRHGERPGAAPLQRAARPARGRGEREPAARAIRRRRTGGDTVSLLEKLRREDGELGMVSALLLLAGVLLPIMFIVVAFARIENGRLAVAQAARDAVRAAVEAPTSSDAQQAADQAIVRAQTQTGVPLRLQL